MARLIELQRQSNKALARLIEHQIGELRRRR